MKLLLVISIFSLGLLSPNAPQISFKSEVLNADTLVEGRSFRGEFKFYNTGDEPLIIKRSLAAAGNVVSSHPKEPIAPGDSGVVKFVMGTRARVGPFNSVISVITNTEPERTILRIKGYIKKNED